MNPAMAVCHCGGRYKLTAPTVREQQDPAKRYPAICQQCGKFRYLSETEAQAAKAANQGGAR